MATDRRSSAASRADARAEETRRDILDAAEELFAERGFAAASMREIARRARTSQALLHHHFGTKANLYDAVKQRFTDRFNVERPAPASGPPDPSFIVSTVRGYFQFLSEHPNLSRLGAWARLEGDEQAWGASDEIWQRAREWVAGAKRAGLIRPEIDDRLLLVVGAAMVQHWIEHRAFLCRALGLDPDEPGLDERYLGQALAILLNGVGTHRPAAAAAATAAAAEKPKRGRRRASSAR